MDMATALAELGVTEGTLDPPPGSGWTATATRRCPGC